MKKEESLKSILAILVIILVCLISFGGIYVKNKNLMKNILPDYVFGMELNKSDIVKLKVTKNEENSPVATEENNTEQTENETENASDENKANEGQAENIYTAENYRISKNIIEKRLNKSGVKQSTIRLDESTGDIVLEVPADIKTDALQNSIQKGKIEIKIDDNGEIIGDNNSISKVETEINDTYANYIGSIVAFKFNFTDDAVKKFKEIKNNYVIPKDENGNDKENTIQIYLDGSGMFGAEGMKESEFLEAAIKGNLPLSLGTYTNDKKVLEDTLEFANRRKVLLENGTLPIDYTIDYAETMYSNINKIAIITVFAALLVAMLVFMLCKFKINGIKAFLSILGFGATLALILRYTKVQISISSIVSIAGMLVLQFIYLFKVLNNKNITSKIFNEKTIEFSKSIIPAFVVAVVISFANIIEISGFGMVMFWGLILFEIFNNIITRAILTNVKK